jgi:hypothetical protein
MTLRDKLKRHKRWHNATVILAVVVLTACTSSMAIDHLFVYFHDAFSPQARTEISYQISSGDTLWLLASKTVQPGEDVRDKIIAIRNLNGMHPTQSLIPGQIVKIPVKRVEDSGLRYTLNDTGNVFIK